MAYLVGVLVQMTSRPLVDVSGPFPLLTLLCHPRPTIPRSAASGSDPMLAVNKSVKLLHNWSESRILTGLDSAVSLAKSVSAGNQSNSLLVIHAHAVESNTDVAS